MKKSMPKVEEKVEDENTLIRLEDFRLRTPECETPQIGKSSELIAIEKDLGLPRPLEMYQPSGDVTENHHKLMVDIDILRERLLFYKAITGAALIVFFLLIRVAINELAIRFL